jgi:hypothetical protein
MFREGKRDSTTWRAAVFVREKVDAELRRRVSEHEPLNETLSWLRSTGAAVSDAIDLLEGIGLRRKDAEHVVRAHPGWKSLGGTERGIK